MKMPQSVVFVRVSETLENIVLTGIFCWNMKELCREIRRGMLQYQKEIML